ncbi:MAG: radical SAM peptide maturase [bacterium]|nr:radical SAM peptide maturase [bacterium]
MKKMNTLTLIESKRKNKYFFDQNMKTTQWCHPLLYYILQLHEGGADVDRWYRGLSGGPIRIEGAGTVSKKEIAYYYRRYMLLRENGFFAGRDTAHCLSERLSADQIKTSLANVRQVTFEVVDYCNLECAYCTYGKFYEDYDRREKKKLHTGAAKKILDYLLELLNSPLNQSQGQLIYTGFYGGEPLLNVPFIREIVEHVYRMKAVRNRFCFNLTTNALLLEKHMDFLVEHDFLLLISLDGDEFNNGYRVFKDGAPAYKKILRNIDALKTRYPEYFESRVNFNAVLHNRNSVDGVYRYFKTRYGKIPSISELNPGGIKDSMKKEFWETYSNINQSVSQAEDYSLLEKEMFTRLPNIDEVSKFADLCSGFAFEDYNGLLTSAKQDKEETRRPTGTCMPFSRKVFVTANGKILPCERIGFQYGLGTVDETKVDLDFEKAAETFNGYFDKIKDQCCRCANWESCLQCIFYLNIEKPDPRCSGFLNKKEYSQFLSTQVSYLEENPRIYKKIMKEVILE